MLQTVLFILISVFFSQMNAGEADSTPSDTHNSQAWVAALEEASKSAEEKGRVVYERYCATCHAERPTIRVNAPVAKRVSDWESRCDHLGYSGLWKGLLEGKGMMPPRGGCFDCTDELLAFSLEWLLPDVPVCKFLPSSDSLSTSDAAQKPR